MTSILKYSILCLLFATLLASCGKVEDAENIITDPEGIKIALTWTNTATDPTAGTDLELYVRQSYNTLLSSNNYYEFEEIEITPQLLNDGTYNLDVYVDDIDRVTNYTITVTGKSTNKVYSRSFGPINASDNNATLKPFSVTIEGDRYNVFY